MKKTEKQNKKAAPAAETALFGQGREQLIKILEGYVASVGEDSAPTVAELAVRLGISKEKLMKLPQHRDRELRRAARNALYGIEHFYISGSVTKKLSSSAAHFYLSNIFGYGRAAEEETDSRMNISVSVEG